MSSAKIITEDLIRSLAPNPAAVSNGKKISSSGDFSGLSKTEDETLIFGQCRGSGKNPYSVSADFSGDTPVLRCSCPSRQYPCKHGIALMYEWLSGKTFTTAPVPEDIAAKRAKAEKRAQKQSEGAAEKKPPKQNKAAAAKKLQKQAEGLVLAENFVNDMLSRGISSVSSASAAQYKSLAKQLGDYYLPEPQAIMNEIVTVAEELSKQPDSAETDRITALCVRLWSTVRKSREYINGKLESGEVLPEDNILYEAMGGVWKLSQLKDTGLYKENARIIQLSFSVIHDDMHKADIDTAYWADLDTGEISRTENIRPVKAAKYIKSEDSAFGVYSIPELYTYPGGMNRRIRWESAQISEPDGEVYEKLLSLSRSSISETVKAAKNELKNTLSEPCAAVLLKFDSIEFALSDNHPVLKSGGETIALRPNQNHRRTCQVLSVTDSRLLKNGALLGELFYVPEEKRFYMCPLSIINESGISRLC